MGTKTLSFWLLGPEKNAFKDGNPTFKIMTKWSIFLKNFIRCFDFWLMFWEMDYPVQMNILNSKCQVKLQKLQTNKKREIFKWKPQSKHPMNLLQKILHFVMILKVGLPSLNAFFSGPKSRNEKVSVPISKRITCRFPNSPYFYS